MPAVTNCYTIEGTMSPTGKRVQIDVDLGDVTAITDARACDGSVLLEGAGYSWSVYGLGDAEVNAIRDACRVARGRR